MGVKAVMAADQHTEKDVYSLIRQAIINKDIVVGYYRGYIRKMCPHVIGEKKGHSQILLYQFAGGSSQGLKPDGSPGNWRCLRVDELSQVSVQKSAGEWHTASNYSAVQTCVDVIDARVEVRSQDTAAVP